MAARRGFRGWLASAGSVLASAVGVVSLPTRRGSVAVMWGGWRRPRVHGWQGLPLGSSAFVFGPASIFTPVGPEGEDVDGAGDMVAGRAGAGEPRAPPSGWCLPIHSVSARLWGSRWRGAMRTRGWSVRPESHPGRRFRSRGLFGCGLGGHVACEARTGSDGLGGCWSALGKAFVHGLRSADRIAPYAAPGR